MPVDRLILSRIEIIMTRLLAEKIRAHQSVDSLADGLDVASYALRLLDEIESRRGGVGRTQVIELVLKMPLSDLIELVESSIDMRKGHEGCVTDPACGDCFRCRFDKVVDKVIESQKPAVIEDPDGFDGPTVRLPTGLPDLPEK